MTPTYRERAAQVARESDIAVTVLLNPDATDIQFWPLHPHQAALTGPEEFCRRQLRIVGVIGLRELTPLCAFKEPLEWHSMANLIAAFLEYVEYQHREDEIARLNRLYVLEHRFFALEESRES